MKHLKFNSIELFIPAGSDFDASKKMFLDFGFQIKWGAEGFIGFEWGNAQFILQDFENKEMAENLMVRIAVDDLDEL